MSLYIEWINRIKTQATAEWLTDGQRAVYDSILGRWQAKPFVCLCGPSGCGKSFIARLLARDKGYVYVHELQAAEPGSSQVIVDDAAYTRLIRPIARELRLGRVILVMRQPPPDPMPHAEVSLGTRDVGQFRRNLYRHQVLSEFLTEAEGTDLEKILRDEAVRRGEPNASD
jgi:ABC-type phosphate transport system ATPase subunit